MALTMLHEKQNRVAVVGIAAGKGGVGKSFLTVFLALALRQLGCRSAIFDADLYGPSIAHMLPADRLPEQKGKAIYPAISQSIPVISFAHIEKGNKATAVRAPIANMLVQTFIENIIWKDVDLLLVDFPPGTGDIPLTLTQKIPFQGVIVITTPQMVAINDARKAIELTQRLGIEVIGIVENMSFYCPEENKQTFFYPFGQGGGEALAAEFALPLLTKLPLSEKACANLDRGISPFFSEEKKDWERNSIQGKIIELARYLTTILRTRPQIEAASGTHLK